MTVDSNDTRDDDVLASLERLRSFDVSRRRSRELRRRCHAILQADPSVERLSWMERPFRRDVLTAIGCVWCLAYLVEIVRCTAAIYGYFGAQ